MTEKLKYTCGSVKMEMQSTRQGGAKISFRALGVQDAIVVPKNLLRQFAEVFSIAANTLRFWSEFVDVPAPGDEEGTPIVEHVEAPAVTVRDVLLLVGIDIPLDRIEERNQVARKAALEWAANEHLRAAGMDNYIELLPCPEWVAYWRK
jgi:hypothetical protein